jgi:hypothetical protein
VLPTPAGIGRQRCAFGLDRRHVAAAIDGFTPRLTIEALALDRYVETGKKPAAAPPFRKAMH